MIIHLNREVNLCVKETVELPFILKKMFLKIQFFYKSENILCLHINKING
jgi:hypothetical protein